MSPVSVEPQSTIFYIFHDFLNFTCFEERGDYPEIPSARSYVRVDDKLIVNNGGLHGNRQECGPVNLAAGLHRIQCSVFQAGGAVDILLRYR